MQIDAGGVPGYFQLATLPVRQVFSRRPPEPPYEWTPAIIEKVIALHLPWAFQEPAAAFERPSGVLLNVGGRHFQILVMGWGPDIAEAESKAEGVTEDGEEEQPL